MATFKVYKSDTCPYCQSAMQFLKTLRSQRDDVELKLYDSVKDRAKVQAAMRRVAASTVPQVFVDGHHIGGWDQLSRWAAAGGLDTYLESGTFERPAKASLWDRLRGRG